MAPFPTGVHLAVSPLSWVNEVLHDLGADTTAETILTEARAAGFSGVEMSRAFPSDPEALAALMDAHRMRLVSGWYSGELAERDLATEIAAVAPHARMLQALGCKVMVYGECAMMAPRAPLDAPMSYRRQMPEAEVAAYGARLTGLARHLLDTYGLRLAYHHHLMMVAETFHEISAILGATGPEVGLLLDTGHAQAAGFPYQMLIQLFGHRIVHIHLKDVRADVLHRVRAGDLSFNAAVLGGMFTVPGDGMIDFAPLARFVRDSGYQGWMVVEAEQNPAKAPPAATVARAFAHITATFAQQEVRA